MGAGLTNSTYWFLIKVSKENSFIILEQRAAESFNKQTNKKIPAVS